MSHLVVLCACRAHQASASPPTREGCRAVAAQRRRRSSTHQHARRRGRACGSASPRAHHARRLSRRSRAAAEADHTISTPADTRAGFGSASPRAHHARRLSRRSRAAAEADHPSARPPIRERASARPARELTTPEGCRAVAAQRRRRTIHQHARSRELTPRREASARPGVHQNWKSSRNISRFTPASRFTIRSWSARRTRRGLESVDYRV